MNIDKKGKRINTIQVIRAIACIMVIICHSSYTDWGQTGVDFFLIISGFVIMYSTEKSGTDSFWLKRIKRIIPLYWSVTIFTSFLIIIAPSLFNSYEVSGVYFIKSLLFIPYYHNGLAGPIVAIGWTLNYEMLFYLIFWLNLKINKKYRGYGTVFSIILLVLIGKIFTLPTIIDYWCNPVLLEFAYGIIIYYVMTVIEKSNWKEKVANYKLSISVFSYVLIIIAIELAEYFYQNIKVSRAYYVAGIISIVVLFYVIFDKQIWCPKWILKIGDHSYEIYLLHIFCVRLCEKVLHRIGVTGLGVMIADIIFSIFCIMCGVEVKNRILQYYRHRKEYIYE